MLPKFTHNLKTQASTIVPVHSKSGTLHFYLYLTDRPTDLQWSKHSSRAAHSPGTVGFSLSARAESLPKFVLVLAHLMEKALKQHLGNLCLNLRTPVHLSFGFILKCLQRIISLLHLEKDTAGTSRIRVQAGEDPGFSHSPAGIWEGHSPCQGGMKRTILLRSPGSGLGWRREAGWQAEKVKKYLKWK